MNILKNKYIYGFLTVVIGFLIAAGPQTVFQVCGVHEHSENVMKCFWTARAELGVGVSISILGLLSAIFGNPILRLGLTAGVLLNGILALLIPTVLIGVCGSNHMNCRALTLPALSVLSILIVAVSVIQAVYLRYTNKEGTQEDGKQTVND
ncbi:MAG: DUF4418 family protein [Clostridiales bacterium]|nr:DUF4418 family protein [Clostridiales bacterium]